MSIPMPDPHELKKTINAINDKFGAGTVKRASDLQPTQHYSTGLTELDYILGGGVPIGRLLMIYGSEGSGKSSLCMHLAAKYPFCTYIDAERSLDPQRAKTFGIDLSRMLIMHPENGEQALTSAMQLADAKVPLIIIDSVAALTPKKEADLDDETDKTPGIALTAGLLNRKIFLLNAKCHKNNVTIIFVNQVRDKFNALMFGEQFSLPGGHALKHASHVILKVGRKETLKVSEQATGIMCKFVAGKNRSAAPMQECEIPLIFDSGFASLETYKEKMKESRKKYLAERKERLKVVGEE